MIQSFSTAPMPQSSPTSPVRPVPRSCGAPSATPAWLAVETEDLHEKQRCLEAILELEPGNQWAREAMEWVQSRQYLGRRQSRRGNTFVGASTVLDSRDGFPFSQRVHREEQ